MEMVCLKSCLDDRQYSAVDQTLGCMTYFVRFASGLRSSPERFDIVYCVGFVLRMIDSARPLSSISLVRYLFRQSMICSCMSKLKRVGVRNGLRRRVRPSELSKRRMRVAPVSAVFTARCKCFTQVSRNAEITNECCSLQKRMKQGEIAS